MNVNKCAHKIVQGLERGEPEIAVGEGLPMVALLLKRFFPKTLFRIVANKP